MYINPKLNIIYISSDIYDLGLYMSSNCMFEFHVENNLYKKCSNFTGWIPITFTIRESRAMTTLFQSPFKKSRLCLIVIVSTLIKVNLPNREGLKLIYKTHCKSYEERLKLLNLYSIQRR